jgi:hypothetical protein
MYVTKISVRKEKGNRKEAFYFLEYIAFWKQLLFFSRHFQLKKEDFYFSAELVIVTKENYYVLESISHGLSQILQSDWLRY